MDWCYLDTRFYRITFLLLSARSIWGLGVGERVRWGDLGVGRWREGSMGREFDDFFYLIPVSKKNATVGPYSKPW
jgi:hypothetical protein